MFSGPRTQLAEPVPGSDERIQARIVHEPRRRLLGWNSSDDGEP
jgi:hypothetical protein